ncbi:MAG: hypothetical protein M4579_002410 [Chaenotheca gracillima]|nr:MAG: hypothetical protein M4579_002410 [Chaenotheca gracillima]
MESEPATRSRRAHGHDEDQDPLQTPTKNTSLPKVPPTLSPSPKFREPPRTTKDDLAAPSDPVTPRRPAFPIRGLSLQMPPTDNTNANMASLLSRVPLSPKLDSTSGYGSPASVLPRHSRGLDFSRACTSLHHSTLADKSSPDASPTLSGKGMNIPQRKGHSSVWSAQDSPVLHSGTPWSAHSHSENPMLSSSVSSSINMLESDSSESTSDDDELMDADDGSDPIITTPQVYKISNPDNSLNNTSPFAGNTAASPGGDWMGTYSPAVRTLMSFQRARLQKRRSRKSSSSASASGSSSMASPNTASPPVLKSVETMGNYFSREASSKVSASRRSSLSWTTRDLRLSPSGESDDGGVFGNGNSKDGRRATPPVTPSGEEKRGVIKRTVTRRGNLLPKTKNFARIQAALLEENAPVDCEVKREAEVVRQVRESDIDVETNHRPAPAEAGDDSLISPRDSESGEPSTAQSFTVQAQRNSGGKEFWDKFEGRCRTPPPPLFNQTSSSGAMDDAMVDSPIMSSRNSSDGQFQDNPAQFLRRRSSFNSRATTPQPPPPLPSAAETTRYLNKRRRDDDFDDSSFKRRAVSPGLSVQNSPILSQSPVQKDGVWGLGLSKTGRESTSAPSTAHGSGDRSNSGGSVSGAGGTTKRVGFQGMCDTNDGIMNMSIE